MARAVSGRRYPRRREDVIWKEVGPEGILLDLSSGAYFGVSPVGLAVWKACDGRTSTEAIGRSVVWTSGATLSRALRDTSGFVSALARARLVEILDRPRA